MQHDWLAITRNERNPSQFWYRIRNQMNRAINQLSLLAKKIPDDKQKEIFSYDNIKRLIISLLNKDDYADPIDELSDSRRTQLAALLIEEGIKVCIKKYELLLSETPALTGPTIDHLNKAKDICKDIAYKVDLNQRKFVTEKEKLTYLFSWNRIPGNDENKLIEFIKDEFGDFDNRWIRAIKKQDEDNTIFFSFRKLPDPPCVFYIKLSNDRKNATVCNYDPDDDEEQVNNNKVQKSLIVKSEYDNLNVYKNKNSREKSITDVI
jgi:hypothetical protein